TQPDGSTVAFSSVEATVLQTELRGGLRVNVDSGVITGALSGDVKDLAPLLAIAGLPAAGGGKLSFAFSENRGQRLTTTLDTGAFAGPDFTADSLAARATLDDLWHERRISARV